MSYLRDTEIRAWCLPVINTSNLNRVQLSRLQELQLSVTDWTDLSQQLDKGDLPKWLMIGDLGKLPSSSLTVDTASQEAADLLSPLAHDQSGGILGAIPVLSFDDSVESEESGFSPEDLDATELAAYVGKFRTNFHSLRQKWTRAFMEVESGYGLVVQDLQKLNHALPLCHQSIGSQPSMNNGDNPSLWSSIVELQSTVMTVSTALTGQDGKLGDVVHQQESLSHIVSTLEDSTDTLTATLTTRLSTVERDLKATENRLLKLLPLLHQLRQAKGSSPTDSAPVIQQRLDELSTRLQDLQELTYDQILNTSTTGSTLPTGRPVPSSSAAAALAPVVIPPSPSAPVDTHGGTSEVMSQLRALQAEMKQLQLRVVGKGVQIANRTFQSFDEVRTWVTTHLPNHRYGLFVDGVSIFEFFTHGHIDAEATYSSFYNQHRTGFQPTYEARVASSIQNLFPTVFGKSDGNVDTAEALPALKTPDKWDSNDGNTGLRYQISRNMADVEFQLQETISSVLGPYSEAKHIAQECLHQAKRFALELAQFITTDFQKWRHRGHSQRDAWKMTSVCVRRIFEELYSERVVARDVYDQKDPDFTTAKFLWATWKAHAVMARYLRHQFYEHPAISAVLACHLADNYVKPDDSHGNKLKSLEERIKSLESTNQTLQSNYDTLRVELGKVKQQHNQLHPAKEVNLNTNKGKNWKGTPTPGSG